MRAAQRCVNIGEPVSREQIVSSYGFGGPPSAVYCIGVFVLLITGECRARVGLEQ